MGRQLVGVAMTSSSDAKLAECLDALSNPMRISIMRALRTPRSLREIEVRSEGEDEGERGAPLSRQGVRRHLDQLIAAGVVATRPGTREYGDTTEFVVNHQRDFVAGRLLCQGLDADRVPPRGLHYDGEHGVGDHHAHQAVGRVSGGGDRY